MSVITSGRLRLGANVWTDVGQSATSQSHLSHPYVERQCGKGTPNGSQQIALSDAYGTVCGIQAPVYNGQRNLYTGRHTLFQSVVVDAHSATLNSNLELETYLARTGQYGNDCALVVAYYGYLDGPTGATVNVSVKSSGDGSVFESSQQSRIECIGFSNGWENGLAEYYVVSSLNKTGSSSNTAYLRNPDTFSFQIIDSRRWFQVNLINVVNWNSSNGYRRMTCRYADLKVEIQ